MSQEEFHVLDELVEAPDSTTAEETARVSTSNQMVPIESGESELSLTEDKKPVNNLSFSENISVGNSPSPKSEEMNEGADEVDWSDIMIVDEYDEEMQLMEPVSPETEALDPPTPSTSQPVKPPHPVEKASPKENVDKKSPKPKTNSVVKPKASPATSASTEKTKSPTEQKSVPKAVSSKSPKQTPKPSTLKKPQQSKSKEKPRTSTEASAPKPPEKLERKEGISVSDPGVGKVKVCTAADSTTKSETKGKQTSSPKSELEPKRAKPVPTVSTYVDSLIGLEYDFKKYTCFYCNPCHAFLSTTAQWEEHITCSKHRKNVCRWRDCMELKKEGQESVAAMKQPEVEKYRDVIVGAELIVEVAGTMGPPKNWVCVLCSAVCSSVELLLGHLTSFLHIDNYMERTEPGLYQPPGKDERVLGYIRYASSEAERRIMEEARILMEKRGRGKMRVYRGVGFQDWLDEESETAELEESLVMDRMGMLFHEEALPEEYTFKYKMIPKNRSVANGDVSQMTVDSSNTMIGMQHLIEIWAPSRRVTPVYYCALCGYLVTNWVVHSTILKHCAAYLMKHYKSVYDCVLLESSSEEEFRRVLALAREKVLLLEGRQSRVDHVIQLLSDQTEVFVAINARIAQKIIEKENLKITPPPRAKKRTSRELGTDKSSNPDKKKPAPNPITKKKPNSTTSKADSTKAVPNAGRPKLSSHSAEPKTESSKKAEPSETPSAKLTSDSKTRAKGTVKAYVKPKSEKLRKPEEKSQILSKPKQGNHFDSRRSSSTSQPPRTGEDKTTVEDRRVKVRSGRYEEERKRKYEEGHIREARDGHRSNERARIRSPVRDASFYPPQARPRTVYDMRHSKNFVPNNDFHSLQEPNRRALVQKILSESSQSSIAGPSGTNKPNEYLSQADLGRLEEMLRNVAQIDLGRRITVQDLDMLRGRLGSHVVDGLLDMIKSQNKALDEVAKSVGYKPPYL